ncbi:hypothetical protein PC115_g6526 [Phytophthora cactorum]|uniref:Uncharacterized protein n=1 Tax=Phytophthora cactorum TaxID=29920 RepID=A0A8T1CYI5_9STRA|nr:hypothetical protein PC115_g6526 [Phytophthora cactorum]
MTPVVVQAPAYAHGYANTYNPGFTPGPVYGGPVYVKRCPMLENITGTMEVAMHATEEAKSLVETSRQNARHL